MMNTMEYHRIKSYYDDDTKVIQMPNVDVDLPQEGMGYLLFESMKKHFGKTALIDLTKQKTYTYDDLFIRTVRTSIKLKNLGIKPGDIISIFAHNQIETITVFLSAFLIGAINATLDPILPDEDLAHLIPQVCPKIFFVSPICEERIEELCRRLKIKALIVVFGESQRNLSYADFNCPNDGEGDFKPYIVKDLDEMCLLKFSSGSSGLPKAICFSHRYYTYHTTTSRVRNRFSLESLYWSVPIQTTLSQIRNGCVYIFTSDFNIIRLWNDIKTYNITEVQLLPYIALEFINCKPENWDGELLYLKILGLAISEKNIIKLRKALPTTKVFSEYGMTETFRLMNSISYEKPTSVGIPLDGMHYKVVDPDTEENLGYYQRGELRVKSQYQLTSYYNMDSSNIWDDEGYFKTGDVVYFDEDFCFYIVDRLKETFKCRYAQISPVKCEEVLESHPDVKMGVVIGIPHESDGNHIMAVVVIKKGSNVTAQEIEDYYNERVADGEKIRLGVKIVDEIPMTPNGKIARKRLQDVVLKGLEKLQV